MKAIAQLLSDPKSGDDYGKSRPLVIGHSVADTFNRLYYFERAAGAYIQALQSGRGSEC